MSPASINLLILKSLRLVLNSTSRAHNLSTHSNCPQIALNFKLGRICKFKSSYHCTCNTYVGPPPSFSQAKALKFKEVPQILLALLMGQVKSFVSKTAPRVTPNDSNFSQPGNKD